MCGRYYIDDGETIADMRKIIEEINAKYQNASEGSVQGSIEEYAEGYVLGSVEGSAAKSKSGSAMKTGEIFPTDSAPVLILRQQAIEPVLMTWGYPKFQSSGVLINARAETAAEKPMFRSSIPKRRCIIPSTGFFEWEHNQGKTKTKFLLQSKESPMLYMAGLYAGFQDKLGKNYAAYVILTVAANASVNTIHDRMPLILDANQNDYWLHDEQYARNLLLTPCPAQLAAIPIWGH